MNKTSILITVFMSLLGLFIGLTINKTNSSEEEKLLEGYTNNTSQSPRSRKATSQFKFKSVHSNETLESMLAKGADSSASEIALWLLDASGSEIAAYWDFRRETGISGDHNRLILHNWLRNDPHAAIAHVADTKYYGSFWTTWGIVDPETALSEALALGEDSNEVKSVVRGLGQLQSKWLIENIDKIPPHTIDAACRSLITWKENSDQTAKLNFLMEHGKGVNSKALATLAKQDPWAAYHWLEENTNLEINELRGRGELDTIIDSVKLSHPDELKRMAANTSSAILKRKFEDAVFTELLTRDPETALDLAENTETPLLAAKRFGEIGLSLLASDPEKSYEIGASMLAGSPETLTFTASIENTNGSVSIMESGDDAAEQFLKSLLAKDPTRTLDMMAAKVNSSSKIFQTISREMIERDIESYIEWVNNQNDPSITRNSASKIATKYAKSGDLLTALTWGLKDGAQQQHQLLSIVTRSGWRNNRADALALIKSSDLSEDVKKNLIQRLK